MSIKNRVARMFSSKDQNESIRCLFILKKREDYNTDIANFDNFTVVTGMYNSSSFVSDMLNLQYIQSKVVVVTDNNDIDREVQDFKPSHVFIEGLWVVPEKFNVLKTLHPTVNWVVRIHSELPFLAQEGIAMDWIHSYITKGIQVSGNSPRINRELQVMLNSLTNSDCTSLVPLLTNYYPVNLSTQHNKLPDSDEINVGCFGAVRPLKNHLSQALAAIEFAETLGKTLRFHINVGRLEMNGANTLKNVQALFNASKRHELVQHDWCSHDDFLLLAKEMDICMQVSFTETFNIVSADAVSSGVPVLTSKEIPWIRTQVADPTSTVDIVSKLLYVWNNKEYVVSQNIQGLATYSNNSIQTWINYFRG